MFDIIIEGAKVIDGSGGSPYSADIGIKGDRIEAIGNFSENGAKDRIRAHGKTVCPGFIDVHSHADLTYFRPDHSTLLEPLVRQGITTFVGGNCGMALAPLTKENWEGQKTYLEVFTQMEFEKDVRWSDMASFLDYLEKDGIVMNTAMLAPHGMIRISALDLSRALASPEQLSDMQNILAECLEGGAIGLSTGLQYFPGSCSDTRELVELGKVLKKYDGIFVSHMRSYTKSTLPNAIEEVVTVARENQIKAQISHIYTVPWFGRAHVQVMNALRFLANHSDVAVKVFPESLLLSGASNTLKIIDEHRKSGLDIGADLTPVTGGFTHLLAFYPPWALEGTREDVMERLADSALRAQMKKDIEEGEPRWDHRGRNDWSLNIIKLLGWSSVQIMAVHSEKNRKYEGRRFVDIAREEGRDPFDVMCDLLLEEEGRVLVIASLGRPDDELTEKMKIIPALLDSSISIVTDAVLLGVGKPSFLFYGCFPKIVGRYVYDMKVISLEEAIKRFTSLPAAQLNIRDRGLIKEGYYADMLIIEPESFRTKATFDDPKHFPQGLEMVMINGKIVLKDGKYDPQIKPGKVLRRQG